MEHHDLRTRLPLHTPQATFSKKPTHNPIERHLFEDFANCLSEYSVSDSRKIVNGSDLSTAGEVTNGIDGSGLPAFVTGASSGIGSETARVLALRGVHAVMGVRNISTGKQVKEAIVNEIPAAKVDVMENYGITVQATERQYRVAVCHQPPRWLAYGQSKLSTLLYDNELARRLKDDGVEITVNSLHPGVITTNLSHHLGVWGGNLNLFEGFLSTLGNLVFKNVQQGASTTCYLALRPQLKGTTGAYFADNNMAKASAKAGDTDMSKKLWDFSMDLIK